MSLHQINTIESFFWHMHKNKRYSYSYFFLLKVGSGISLGHPVGATGAIMTVKLMEEMELRDQSLGLVTMCVGGGQGVATIFERGS